MGVWSWFRDLFSRRSDPAPTPPPPTPPPPIDPSPRPGGASALPRSDADLRAAFRPLMALATTAITQAGASGVDRAWGAPAALTLADALSGFRALLAADWARWPPDRQGVALVQILARAQSVDPGVVDGWWGPATAEAYAALLHLRDHGVVPPEAPVWREGRDGDAPIQANPHGWPLEDRDQRALWAFYGDPADDGALRRVRTPWIFRVGWNLDQTRSHLWCHAKAADSLGDVLERVHQHYGAAEIQRLRLDVFSGDHADRRMRGASRRWSTHAWGVAFDFDAVNNPLHWGRERARLARSEYRDFWEIWEREGWWSLGRQENYDWMHVQAARKRSGA